jgi:hypothetical protein
MPLMVMQPLGPVPRRMSRTNLAMAQQPLTINVSPPTAGARRAAHHPGSRMSKDHGTVLMRGSFGIQARGTPSDPGCAGRGSIIPIGSRPHTCETCPFGANTTATSSHLTSGSSCWLQARDVWLSSCTDAVTKLRTRCLASASAVRRPRGARAFAPGETFRRETTHRGSPRPRTPLVGERSGPEPSIITHKALRRS